MVAGVALRCHLPSAYRHRAYIVAGAQEGGDDARGNEGRNDDARNPDEGTDEGIAGMDAGAAFGGDGRCPVGEGSGNPELGGVRRLTGEFAANGNSVTVGSGWSIAGNPGCVGNP